MYPYPTQSPTAIRCPMSTARFVNPALFRRIHAANQTAYDVMVAIAEREKVPVELDGVNLVITVCEESNYWAYQIVAEWHNSY